LDDVSVTPIPPVAFQTSTSSSTGFNLSWNTGSGLTYQVQYKTNLMQATWINLGSPVAGTGGQLLISDTNAISASSERFYRLVVSP
jgi:hypothetical protein